MPYQDRGGAKSGAACKKETPENSQAGFSGPLLTFLNDMRNFAACGPRPEALPLDSAAFEKAGETFDYALRKVRRFA